VGDNCQRSSGGGQSRREDACQASGGSRGSAYRGSRIHAHIDIESAETPIGVASKGGKATVTESGRMVEA
jgi:hypothetical protein